MTAHQWYLFVSLAALGLMGTAQAQAEGIPTPGCIAKAFMETTSGIGTDLHSGLTYAAAEVVLPTPQIFEARALAAVGSGSNPVAYTKTYVYGLAAASDIISYSYAKGTNVFAWTPVSDTLPGGMPIVARYSIDLDGILYSWGNNTHSVKSSLDMWFAVYDHAVGQLACLSGVAAIEMSYPPIVFTETGDLVGRFTWNGQDDPSAETDTQFTINFNATIGSTYIIEVILESGLDAGSLSESTSWSDFYNTFSYQFLAAYDPADVEFKTPLDVQMVAIPEPGALALLVMASLSLLCYTSRRRRS